MLFILALLLYFWYFYHPASPAPVPEPFTAAPDPPVPFRLSLVKRHSHAFSFVVNGRRLLWAHEFDSPSHLVLRQKVVERNDCHPYTRPEVRIPAKGLSLYRYLQEHPDFAPAAADLPQQQQQQRQPHREGAVFYFTCRDRRIAGLGACPPGTLFQNQLCVGVGSCTGLADGTRLPVPGDLRWYAECGGGREHRKKCPRATFFYHDRCVPQDDLTHACQLHDTLAPLKLDDRTLFECRNHQPHVTRCAPGTRVLDRPFCEPAQCEGRADGERVPLPDQSRGPFRFSPGYRLCAGGRVAETVACPSEWDGSRDKGEDLTSLPTVFDGQRCAIPAFCDNVRSPDPDVIVPVREFTRHVRNWSLSPAYDRLAGYVCTATGRKRLSVEPGHRIGKRFKVEPACPPSPSSLLLPVDGDEPRRYYHCGHRRVEWCARGQFFDGKGCRPVPAEGVFRYRGLPLFRMEGLNAEGWLGARDVLTPQPPRTACEGPEYVHLSVHNVCAHLACRPYAFLALMPGAFFLPDGGARCRYDPATRHIRREPVAGVRYTFWDQRVVEAPTPDACTFGQRLRTGHFVWDSTVYATCDRERPFVFCPSPHTTGLLPDGACAPPADHVVRHEASGEHTAYATNEVQRIFAETERTRYRLNKADRTLYELAPGESAGVPVGTRLNLQTDQPVRLQLRYRVTHPPSVAFRYEADGTVTTLAADDPTLAFRMAEQRFVARAMDFPTYAPRILVDGWQG